LRFVVWNEIYCGPIVQTERSSRELQDLQFSAAPKSGLDTHFPQTLITGNKYLYFYPGKNGNENFYIKRGSHFEILIYKPYIIVNDSINSIAENLQYQNQFSEYFNKNQEIQSRVFSTK